MGIKRINGGIGVKVSTRVCEAHGSGSSPEYRPMINVIYKQMPEYPNKRWWVYVYKQGSTQAVLVNRAITYVVAKEWVARQMRHWGEDGIGWERAYNRHSSTYLSSALFKRSFPQHFILDLSKKPVV